MADRSLAYAFDAYGTLFDTASAARQHAYEIGPLWSALADLWRAKQLEYTWVNSAISSPHGNPPLLPFRELTRISLHYALEALELDPELAPRLLEHYTRLETFDDVRVCLQRLKSAGATLLVFSNADIDQLDDLIAANALNPLFDHLISARSAGAYKPSPRVYHLVTQVLSVPPEDIVFVSSNRWDIAGATAVGFETAWINRSGKPDEYPHLPPKRVLRSLCELA